MTAPMPLRFYNPVKDLCGKMNLDYETVIGHGLSSKMREAYVNAEIQKPVEQIKKEDKKRVQHKVDFLNRKYGGVSQTGTGTGEAEDKGRIRYDAGITVEPILSDNSEMDKSTIVSNSVEVGSSNPYTGMRRANIWVPGKGVEAMD